MIDDRADPGGRVQDLMSPEAYPTDAYLFLRLKLHLWYEPTLIIIFMLHIWLWYCKPDLDYRYTNR